MKSVLFIVGAAIGHIGRSLMIAKALERRSEVRIHFACLASGSAFGRELVGSEYPVTLFPSFSQSDMGASCTAVLETLMADFRPDLIYCDINPLPQLLLVRFPDVPRVFLVNAYETRLGADVTVQDLMWAQFGAQWNRLRQQRGLLAVDNPRAFFDADCVLLPDPPSVVGVSDKELPDGYMRVGACIWDSPGDCLPDGLENSRDLMLLSMGSTGKHSLPIEAVERIRQRVGASGMVRVGAYDPGYDERVRQYQWLPGDQLLAHCCFCLTQGGAGSTYQALRAGVPVACIPSHRNHVALALRLEKIGAGVLLYPEIWEQQLNEQPWDLERLNAGARLLASEMQSNDGPAYSADIMRNMLD